MERRKVVFDGLSMVDDQIVVEGSKITGSYLDVRSYRYANCST